MAQPKNTHTFYANCCTNGYSIPLLLHIIGNELPNDRLAFYLFHYLVFLCDWVPFITQQIAEKSSHHQQCHCSLVLVRCPFGGSIYGAYSVRTCCAWIYALNRFQVILPSAHVYGWVWMSGKMWLFVSCEQSMNIKNWANQQRHPLEVRMSRSRYKPVERYGKNYLTFVAPFYSNILINTAVLCRLLGCSRMFYFAQ